MIFGICIWHDELVEHAVQQIAHRPSNALSQGEIIVFRMISYTNMPTLPLTLILMRKEHPSIKCDFWIVLKHKFLSMTWELSHTADTSGGVFRGRSNARL